MNTVFLLMAKFDSVTLTMEQVCALTEKKEKTIRNRVYAGKFPAPTSDGVWLVQDIADYLDSTRAAPQAMKAA